VFSGTYDQMLDNGFWSVRGAGTGSGVGELDMILQPRNGSYTNWTPGSAFTILSRANSGNSWDATGMGFCNNPSASVSVTRRDRVISFSDNTQFLLLMFYEKIYASRSS
jgi:hypothetical protein